MRSTKASNQPRDELGRWTAYKHRQNKRDKLIPVDEGGDMGFGPNSPDFLILSAAIVEDPEKWRAVAEHYPWNTFGNHNDMELKYRSSSHEVRRAVLEEIADLEPDIRAVAVNKRRLPKDWEGVEGDKLYLKTVEALMDNVMADIGGKVTVIYDPHASLGKTKGIKRAEDAAKGYGVELSAAIQDRRSEGELALQTNDFIPGAIGDRLNLKRTGNYEIIEPYVNLRKVERKR